MKKTIINIVLVLTTLIIYYLQSNFFTWFNIAGIVPNLFIIFTLFIGLFSTRTMGTAYGMVIGLILDLLLGNKVGVNAATLGLIGFLAGEFDRNFSKDSRMTVMLMVLLATVLVESINYLLKYILLSSSVEIWSFITILLIETIFNCILTIILYPLMQKAGYYIENEYNGNKILTRYF